MKIEQSNGENHYFDETGAEIHAGDTVILNGEERCKKVYLTTENELGTDATNPSWIERGIACECEFGIYPFSEEDTVRIVINTGDRK